MSRIYKGAPHPEIERTRMADPVYVAEPPSRARPSDRAIAAAFRHAAEFPGGLDGLSAQTFADSVIAYAQRNGEPRAGDGDAVLDLIPDKCVLIEAARHAHENRVYQDGWNNCRKAMIHNIRLQRAGLLLPSKNKPFIPPAAQRNEGDV